ncbi:dihydrofolate reductase family protein [Tellurirhabdus rosea]|uniref:dihydrofolate reductase family protein n=1 Tax=Tellurirhabdus rosea TaxID=2674997 RepID=UPI00225B58FD|nr:dihydrofolate reductase family protein [Tellurirhabdus rosea]
MTHPKVSVFIGLSQDGFIARPNGEIDWLTDERYALPGEDFGYQTFYDSIDTLVTGRMTFEKVLTFDAWPYEGKRVIVLSSTGIEPPEALREKVTVLAMPPAELLKTVAEQGGRHIYIDGGVTIQRFLRDGLVDSLTLTRLPVLLGEGLPLFGPLGSDVHLRHTETRTFANGMVQSRYEVLRG